MAFDLLHLDVALPGELLGLRLQAPLRQRPLCGQLLHHLHRGLGIGVAAGLELLDLPFEIPHLLLELAVRLALGEVALLDELLPLRVGLLPRVGDGRLDALERTVLRLPLADLEEPLVAGERVEDVEGKGDVVEIEPEDLILTVPQTKDPAIEEIDVGDDDGLDQGPLAAGRGPALDRSGEDHRLLPLLLEDLQLRLVAAVAHHLLDLDRPGSRARLDQRRPVDIGGVVFRDGAGEGEEDFLEAGRHGAGLAEGIGEA